MGNVIQMERQESLVSINSSTIDGETINTVNARELHSFLTVSARFNDWVKNRIEQFGFVENQDFVALTKNLVSGGKQTDYYLTIDMAKELSMVERNAKGKQARQYFIECERQAKSIDPMAALNDPAMMRTLLGTYAEKVITLEATVSQQAPKVEALDRISHADGAMCITNAAKTLQVRPKDLFAEMSQRKFIYRRQGGKGWVGYQDRIQAGYLTHKVTTICLSDGTEKITESVLVTPKGIVRLAELLGKVA